MVFPGFFPLGIPKVQRCDNLVDLEKSCKMSIYLQNLVSIQRRTSRLTFDDLAEKSEKGSISNLSTKSFAHGGVKIES